MKLVSALKLGVAFSSLAAHMVKKKQTHVVFIKDVEGTFPGEFKEKVHTFTPASCQFRVKHRSCQVAIS